MASDEVVLRGRCRCGQRYRIRHARPGRVVHCPKCGRPIVIRPEDITAANTGLPLAPDQPEDEPLDAIPLDGAQLKLAPADARPGLTDRRVLCGDDVALASATRTMRYHSTELETPPASGWDDDAAPAGSYAALLRDLAASFVLAGRPGNLGHLLLRVAICAVLLWVLVTVPLIFSFVAGWLLLLGIHLYAVRFFWGTLSLAAAGEDDLAGLNEDWEWIQDAIIPALCLIVFTLAALVPWLLVTWLVPATVSGRPGLQVAAFALGVFFWPAMVMAASFSSPLAAVRPDIVVRVVLAIGPAYLLGWLVVVATFALWLGMVWAIGWLAALTPLPGAGLLFLSVFAAFYSGYVAFRTLGVLYRHRGHRLRW